MKIRKIIQLWLMAIFSVAMWSCDEDVDVSFIPQSYLDVSTWEEVLLLPYDDATYGFDFSEKDHNNTSRDCYLTQDAVNIVNDFLFDGVSHIKMYEASAIDFKANLEIPTTWDAINPPLEAGAYYLLECADGYALVQPVSMEYSEWLIKYIYIPNVSQLKAQL